MRPETTKKIILLTALVLFVAVNLYGYTQLVPEDMLCLRPDSSVKYDATRLAGCFETPTYTMRLTTQSQTISTSPRISTVMLDFTYNSSNKTLTVIALNRT